MLIVHFLRIFWLESIYPFHLDFFHFIAHQPGDKSCFASLREPKEKKDLYFLISIVFNFIDSFLSFLTAFLNHSEHIHDIDATYYSSQNS